ncbi:MAG TPA: family 1 glycosylhydrolase [Brevundimonas sp.]|nr:family 1 glycosylhydrolase [Brevundimonas sp.]
MELWGGHECTVSRVGDRWNDQSRLSGHDDRPGDLDLFAELGLKALRYPVLWERTERERGVFDWNLADDRLQRIRSLGMRPIVGLVHHGSGPAWTHLLDPGFAEGVAGFAGQVAARYPWVEDWTPVNEPLTTARFSALYGHWYPHLRDEGAFWRALLNQIDAVRLSMKAVRAVNPTARLIQTEDFGTTWGTPPCRDQVDFENARRLMTWDLLTGRVERDHPMWTQVSRFGLGDRLREIADDPCPPDVIGMNHYVTSDRFLDHRLKRYPAHTHGGNGRVEYADVEAVRVLEDRPCGWDWNLQRLWLRYRLPVAITECHIGCTPEEQQRWLAQACHAALEASRSGVDVRALTAWSLLGAYDWDSLLTRMRGHYEPGAFDVSDGIPRPTPLAETIRHIARYGAAPAHLVEGWWNEPARLLYSPCQSAEMSECRL